MKKDIMAEYFPWDYSDEKTEIKNAISSQTEVLNQIEERIEEHRINGSLSFAVILDEKADAVQLHISKLKQRLQELHEEEEIDRRNGAMTNEN